MRSEASHLTQNRRLAGAALAVMLCCLLLGCSDAAGAQSTPAASDAGLAGATCLPVPESATSASCAVMPTLVAQHVERSPLLDGQVDDIWLDAIPLPVPLSWGRHGEEQALQVTLRSLYDDEAIYFLAEWPSPLPSSEPAAVRNRLTLHFDLPAPAPDAAERMCLVACHTAFADERGRLAYISAETIPPGRTSPLPAAGGWDAGTWRLEWSRPLRIDNHFDVQFEDLEQAYPFFVKVFAWQEGRADPVSPDCLLVFQP
jgi:hypothetical protein